MKSILLTTSFCVLSVLPAASAQDVTFTVTPTNGTAFSFSFDPTIPSTNSATFVEYNPIPATTDAGFIATDPASYSGLDLDISPDVAVSNNNYFSGPIIFIAGPTYPAFINGTYDLTPLTGNGYTGSSYGDSVLVISGGVSATPEPSSMVLLGTGVLGLIDTARRRRKSA